jgi:hypothetical protein
MEAFHAALTEAQKLDPRLLDARDQKKWSELQDAIAPITTIYYGYHGEANIQQPVLMNEKVIEWNWGSYAGMDVVCNGIIDRLTRVRVLVDTKTASAVGKEWKSDLKKRLLREPQMGFYLRYLERLNVLDPATVSSIEYEIIVKPYRGSDPRIETIDVTREVMRFQPVFEQQMDWTIREMCEFYSKCKDAEPWPMSTSACTSMIWGDCDFLPVCAGREEITGKLYQIKKERDLVEV